MSTTTGPRRGLTRVSALVLRASICAVLAAVVVFTPGSGQTPGPGRTPAFGLIVLGVFLLLQAVVLVAGARAVAASALGRRLVLLRAALSAVAGVAALVAVPAGFGALLWIETLVFLALGVLELVGGIRRSEAVETTSDAVVIGGLQVLVGLMLVILDPDVAFVIGVLGAWGAVVAVYLGIAAAGIKRQDRAA